MGTRAHTTQLVDQVKEQEEEQRRRGGQGGRGGRMGGGMGGGVRGGMGGRGASAFAFSLGDCRRLAGCGSGLVQATLTLAPLLLPSPDHLTPPPSPLPHLPHPAPNHSPNHAPTHPTQAAAQIVAAVAAAVEAGPAGAAHGAGAAEEEQGGCERAGVRVRAVDAVYCTGARRGARQ